MIEARYFDGRDTRPHAVQLEVLDGFLQIKGDDVRRIEVVRAVRFGAAYAHAPSRMQLPGGASCEVRDVNDFLLLRRWCGQDQGVIERIEARWRYALLGVALILATGFAGYFWGVPLLADAIVEHAPHGLDARLGRDSLEQIESYGLIGPSRPLSAREVRLSSRFATLTAATGVPYQLVFRSFRGGPNAFALPGGTILVSNEIEDIAPDDDAMLFVMAHELGHVHYRHGMKSLARGTMTAVIMSWYVGDVSSALAIASAGVANLRYSRHDEAQADAFSAGLLRSHGISTQPAADLFRTLESRATAPAPKQPDPSGHLQLPDYLSSHPATDDRIKMLEQDHS